MWDMGVWPKLKLKPLGRFLCGHPCFRALCKFLYAQY